MTTDDTIGAQDFGTQVRLARQNAGLSLRKFAGICGISHSYLYVIERGIQIPPQRTKDRICAAVFDITFHYPCVWKK